GSTRSPGQGSGKAPAWTGAPAPGRAGGAVAPDSRNWTRSFFVTRPAIPLPCNPLISTPWSAAMRRTSGEDFVRMRSSKEVPPFVVAGAVGTVGTAGTAERAEVTRVGAACAPAATLAVAGVATGVGAAAGPAGAGMDAVTSVSM